MWADILEAQAFKEGHGWVAQDAGNHRVQLAQVGSNLSRPTQATLTQGDLARSLVRTEIAPMPFGRIGKVEFSRINEEDVLKWRTNVKDSLNLKELPISINCDR